MGRITIFTAEGCPHCKRVQVALHSRDIPFVLIDVSRDTKRRADMVALCDRTSTPQVFFNTAHIGGADETLKVLQKWDDELLQQNSSRSKNGYTSPLHRYQVEIASNFDPVNPRFAIPQEAENESSSLARPEQALPNAYEPSTLQQQQQQQAEQHPKLSIPDSFAAASTTTSEQHGSNHLHFVVLPNNGQKTLSILQVTETLKQILPRVDHIRRPMLYKKTFTRDEAVQAFSSHYGLESGEAMEFGRALQQLQILHSVPSKKQEQDFVGGDTETLFRLQCDDQPHVLNSYRIWRSSSSSSHVTTDAAVSSSSSDADIVANHHAMTLVHRLNDMMMEIEKRVTDNNGGIHYTKVLPQQDDNDENDQHLATMYTQFEHAACELQAVNMVLMNDKTKNVSINSIALILQQLDTNVIYRQYSLTYNGIQHTILLYHSPGLLHELVQSHDQVRLYEARGCNNQCVSSCVFQHGWL
jgi:glutaredoxin